MVHKEAMHMGNPVTVSEKSKVVKEDVVGNSVMWSTSMDPLSAYIDHDGFEEIEIDENGNLYITLKFFEENCARITSNVVRCEGRSWLPCKVLVAKGVKDFTIDVSRHQRHPGSSGFSDLYEIDSASLSFTLLSGAKYILKIDKAYAKKKIEDTFGIKWSDCESL